MTALLQVENLKKSFSIPAGPWQKAQTLQAVRGVSFELQEGETLGIVGESGCGKSTLGKLLLSLLEADEGRVLFEGRDLQQMSPRQLRPLRRNLQMVFQDPYSSLNPRMSVGQILSEPFRIHGMKQGKERRKAVEHLMETVGLPVDYIDRYPHEFSGGQRQRIGIARALAVRPRLIVADEPVSALDLSIQAQVINLLQDIQQDYNLTYVVIAHDLAVVEHISDRIAVMYLGKIVESAPASELICRPKHPYSEALLAAVPTPDPKQQRSVPSLKGEVPSPIHPPSGCPFHPRCSYAQPRCTTEVPQLDPIGSKRSVACHYHDRVGTADATS